MGKRSDERPVRPVAQNRKARFRFHIIEVAEAGIALTGNEVKSLREGRVSLDESYARVRGGEVHLIDCHIAPYEKTGFDRPDPRRPRKLLLRRGEIRKVASRVIQRGLTLVPLRLYFRGPWAKVEIAIVRGKSRADRRAEIRKRAHKREIERAVSGRGRGRRKKRRSPGGGGARRGPRR